MKEKDVKSPPIEELKIKVASSCNILHDQGLVDYLGHVSARVLGTDKILISARKKGAMTSLADITAEDVALMDLNSKKNLEKNELNIPGEAELHTCIYRARNDVGCVVHTHQPLATAFSISNKDILPIFNEGYETVASGIPNFASTRDLVTTFEVGEDLAKTVGKYDICLLKGHGVITLGKSVEEATINAINLEIQAKMNILVYLLETAKQMPKARIEPFPEKPSLSPSKIKGAFKYYESIAQGHSHARGA